MRGVYSAGVVTALEELGLQDAFDEVIGISAGAATAAYFLAGQAALGTKIYYEDLASKEFINPLRRGNVLNVSFLHEVFTERKPLDQAAIYASRSNFYIGVTNISAVQPEYIHVNHTADKDIIKLIQASSSVPGMTPPTKIDGVLYSDGITTCRNPIQFAVETLRCTDILYVTNQPLRQKDTITFGEKLFSRIATRSYGTEFRSAYLERHTMSDETASTTYPADIRIGVLCPASMPVKRLSKDAAKLKKIAEQARQQTLDLFK